MAIKEMTIKEWMENGGKNEEEFETFMGYQGFKVPCQFERIGFNEFQINGTNWFITIKYGDYINEPNHLILSNRYYKETQVFYMTFPEERFPFYRL